MTRARALHAGAIALGLAPLALLAIAGARDGLGANPIEAITHETGDWALRLLLATLAVTPLRRATGWSQLAPLRRTLGLLCFTYACAHLSTWAVLDLGLDPGAIAEDLRERRFVMAGLAAFSCLVPLAATSTRGSIRRLGRRWIRLHRLVYVAAFAAVLHFLWLVKADLREPLAYAAVLAVLLAARLRAEPASLARWYAARGRSQGGVGMLRRIALLVLGLVVIAGAYLASIALGLLGRHSDPGEPTGAPVPPAVVAARTAGTVSGDKQILFGDFHVHTTFSTDAFRGSLPITQGEGAHPPADACDFARWCSALDFWALTDHAEGITPQRWSESAESIRQCNALAGDAANPDVVAFLGWEWTQIGVTPEDHYGHKNVILRETAPDRIPARPVAAVGALMRVIGAMPLRTRLNLPFLDFRNRQRYYDFAEFIDEIAATPACPDGVDTRELPVGCRESASTPRELFEKLAQWGGEAIVIPHGTTWGFYTPPGSSWDKQLVAGQHDPARQTLIEVFSGHGNSEEYRGWREVIFDADGRASCPEPTKDYLPSCWRAGELIRERCAQAGLEAAECERRAAAARLNYLAAGRSGLRTVSGAAVEEWLDSGQCRDCYMPAFNYRPKSSSQYIAALTNFDDPAAPRRFRFGYIASSDNHTARPGTGYKEIRDGFSDQFGAKDEVWRRRQVAPSEERTPESVPFDPRTSDLPGFAQVEFERQSSFFITGGLVAAHSAGRSRDAIWQALERKEVYGTSGDRILLWFDLVNGPGGRRLPMGSEAKLAEAPRFAVRAVGTFEQKPGCPADTGLRADRIERLCRGECYHPGDARKRIARIEIVRISPQARPGEPIGELISDPWLRVECPQDPGGCSVEFEDPAFASGGRDVVYYARAIEQASPTVNAANLRCRRDEEGNCVEARPCWGDYRLDRSDDCLAPAEERAWSSPIYVDFARD